MNIIEERHPYKPIKEETKGKLPELITQIIEGLEREITMRDEDIRRLKLEITRLQQDRQKEIDRAVMKADAMHSHF